MSTQTGAILSQAPEESITIVKEFGYNLGIAFQIMDDILDFAGSEEEMGKPIGSDLTQGTLSLPSMLFMERYPKDNPVQELFKKRQNHEDIKKAIDMVRNSTIIQECYEEASDYRDRACRNLVRLPNESNRNALIELANYVVERKR